MPSTAFKVTENSKEQMKLLIRYGSMLVNGNTQIGKKLLLELKNLTVKPNGTKFFITVSDKQSVVSVYHGTVTVTDLTTSEEKIVDAGFSFRYTGNQGSVIPLEDSSGIQAVSDNIAVVDNNIMNMTYTEPAKDNTGTDQAGFSFKSFVKDNLIYIVGGVFAIAVMLIFLFRKKEKRPPPL